MVVTVLLNIPPPTHPLTVAYPGGFDYDLTHFIRGLDPGGFLNTLFWWVTFTGSITFMVLITIALYLAGARKEALVFALVFILANVVAFGLKYTIARLRPSDLGVHLGPSPRFQVVTPRTPLHWPLRLRPMDNVPLYLQQATSRVQSHTIRHQRSARPNHQACGS